MKQAVLLGRTAGLRPSVVRRLERLSQRRHPEEGGADLLTLQRLAAESRELELPLSLVVDGRGLGRLLWVGPLEQSGRLLERLPGSQRRQGPNLRLFTCVGRSRQLDPQAGEATVGLDLQPLFWLRFPDHAEAGGLWPAAGFAPGGSAAQPWQPLASGALAELSEPGALGSTEPETTEPSRRIEGPERVLLLALTPGDPIEAQREVGELEGLVRSAGGEPVGLVQQRRQQVSPQTVWGEGKVQEAALEARRVGATLVVTDRELSPGQARNLERMLDLPVSDRSELILDIFAQRASSSAGRLQVELAQLRYRLPRLSGRGLSLSRQGGGIGTRGPGETQLEKDRRVIASRVDRLQKEVRQLGEHRSRLRQGRRGQRRLALVGYTNAGKSSLLNALTKPVAGEEALAEDKLFATLDPTTRRLDRPNPTGGPPTSLLLTDTVGFIRGLPPPLVEAFRSTLEETLEADQLLIVVDLSDPAWIHQVRTVEAILDDLGSAAPRRLIGNQIDRCPVEAIEQARLHDPQALFISATAGLGLERLRDWLFDPTPAL
ncbi:GTPase HflX [Cyanobium sp. Morenito 9A2]|uniref:GTPase HflX n=1 Tax=Cyanobium sp. Morenito 9A2 TaxID=2823718 RepID=UPI0020CF7BB8|nr:GTPase HflX [Cyanobium sp. Morenito 9A2]MCP9849862.1 GTPase HflX [Cyanobium sp. Morenito 9A2]